MSADEFAALAIHKAVRGESLPPVNGSLSEPWRSILEAVVSVENVPEWRAEAFDKALATLEPETAGEIRAAVFRADPNKPLVLPRPRYVVRNLAYAMQTQPPSDAIVEGLINAGDLVLFYGEPGSKKTFSLLSLGVCVAAGKPWLEFQTTQTKVLFIDEESGEWRLNDRLARVARGELVDENTPFEYVSLAGFKLDNPTDTTILQSLIEESGAGLVIIDALADILDGDENSKQDVHPVFTALRKIADATGAAIVLIHHSNKAGGYRGSSAIKGAVDLMVEVTSGEGSNLIAFKTIKMRDFEPKKWAAAATWVDDQFYMTPAELEENKTAGKGERYVLRYLEENGQATKEEITGHADICSENSARLAIYSLADKGLIERVDSGGRGVTAIYGLAK